MQQGVSAGVLIRDLVLFMIKLFLDGFKDVVMIWLSPCAVLIDLLVGGRRRGRCFYAVMRLGEKWDMWLNLHGASRRAALNPDGLFGESLAGDATFLGEMEELVRRERETARARPAGPISAVRPAIPARR